jgi:hypothetical protein
MKPADDRQQVLLREALQEGRRETIALDFPEDTMKTQCGLALDGLKRRL